jgi:hypothetical protein
VQIEADHPDIPINKVVDEKIIIKKGAAEQKNLRNAAPPPKNMKRNAYQSQASVRWCCLPPDGTWCPAAIDEEWTADRPSCLACTNRRLKKIVLPRVKKVARFFLVQYTKTVENIPN